MLRAARCGQRGHRLELGGGPVLRRLRQVGGEGGAAEGQEVLHPIHLHSSPALSDVAGRTLRLVAIMYY